MRLSSSFSASNYNSPTTYTQASDVLLSKTRVQEPTGACHTWHTEAREHERQSVGVFCVCVCVLDKVLQTNTHRATQRNTRRANINARSRARYAARYFSTYSKYTIHSFRPGRAGPEWTTPRVDDAERRRREEVLAVEQFDFTSKYSSQRVYKRCMNMAPYISPVVVARKYAFTLCNIYTM